VSQPVVKFKRLPHGRGVKLPEYISLGAAGMDLCAAIDEPVKLPPNIVTKIPIGFQIEIPPGFEGQVRMRSGLGTKFGLMIPNAPGTIDSDYRGEIMVALIHFNGVPLIVEPGDRIAQLIIAPVAFADIWEVSELSETARGTGGFGSTGR
jgi:dUTP pyrophosphatase